MNEKDYILAGKITGKAREESKKLIKKGAKYTEIADKIEEIIIKLGAKPAFPVNISVNEYAAHDTARPNDDRTLKEGDIIKIDLGAHVNGWMGDTAYTIEIETNKQEALINASKNALENALKIITKDTQLKEIGKTIEETIKKQGFNPIRNLGGHPLGEYKIHGSFIIPNYNNYSTQKIGTGSFAIEPFATNGDGWVIDTPETLIYSLKNPKPVRNVLARELLKHVQKNYGTLPFAERWIARDFKHYELALRTLMQEEIIHGYHILREKNKGLVSQHEHSILINEKTLITTA